MNPLNRQVFQQSVAANPQLWKDALQKYRMEARNADAVLELMQGGGDFNYRVESGQFVPSHRLAPLTLEERMDIIPIHRDRLLQRLMLRVAKLREEEYLSYTDKKMLIMNKESHTRIFDFLNYKLNYHNQQPDNYNFEPRRLSKLFEKLLQDSPRIKEPSVKEADKQAKAIRRLQDQRQALIVQLRQLQPRGRDIQSFGKSPAKWHQEAEQLPEPRRTKILNLLNQHLGHVELENLQNLQIVEEDLNDVRTPQGLADLNMFLCQLRPILNDGNHYQREQIRQEIARLDREINPERQNPPAPVVQPLTPQAAAPVDPNRAELPAVQAPDIRVPAAEPAFAQAPHVGPAPANSAPRAAPIVRAPAAASAARQAPKASRIPISQPIAAFFQGVVNKMISIWKAFIKLFKK